MRAAGFSPFTWPNVRYQWPPYNIWSPQARGLFFWWPTIGLAGGPTITDKIGTNNGTLNSGALWSNISGIPAIDLDGSSTADIALGQTVSALSSSSPGTVSIWFNPDVFLTRALLGGSAAENYFFWKFVSGPPFIFRVANPTDRIDYVIPEPIVGAWHLVTVTRDGTNQRLFWNGIESTSGVLTTDDTTNIDFIGRYSGTGEDFNGRVRDIRIYNRALSAADAYQLYAPSTRWDLYHPPSRAFFLHTAAVAGGTILPQMMQHYYG